MPDLITHTTAAYFISRAHVNFRNRIAFYLGTILPDLLSRPICILYPKAFEWTIAIHTPIFSILACVLIAQFFESKIRKRLLIGMIFGVSLHFILDIFQRHLVPTYPLLFPFTWRSFEIGLFWPEQSLMLAPIWILAIAATEVIIWKRRHTF